MKRAKNNLGFRKIASNIFPIISILCVHENLPLCQAFCAIVLIGPSIMNMLKKCFKIKLLRIICLTIEMYKKPNTLPSLKDHS